MGTVTVSCECLGLRKMCSELGTGTHPSAQHLDQVKRKEEKMEVRQEKETSVLLNTGDCDIYNILNICFGSLQSLLHSNLQSPKGVVLPRRSVVACTCECVTSDHSSEASICIVFTSMPILQPHWQR